MATNKKKITKKKIVQKLTKKTAKKPAQKTKAPVKISTKSAAPAFSWQKIISPLNDRLVVSIPELKETTTGGIIIPGSVTVQSTKGKVLAVGPGRRTKKGNLRPPDVKVGDEVLYAAHSGTKLAVKGQDVLILREEEVLGILT